MNYVRMGNSGLKITEIWYSADALQRDNVNWINIIVQNRP